VSTKPRNAIHTAKNRLEDAQPCTQKVQSGQRGPAQSVEKLWRDAEIYRLHVAGKSNAEISTILGVHRNKVSAVIKAGGPPAPSNPLVSIESLDQKLFRNLAAGMDSADLDEKRFWTKLYADNRGIPGAEKPQNGGGNNYFGYSVEELAKLEELRDAKLANGLSKHKGAVVVEQKD
jgi:hypothetical protein